MYGGNHKDQGCRHQEHQSIVSPIKVIQENAIWGLELKRQVACIDWDHYNVDEAARDALVFHLDPKDPGELSWSQDNFKEYDMFKLGTMTWDHQRVPGGGPRKKNRCLSGAKAEKFQYYYYYLGLWGGSRGRSSRKP